MTAYPTQVRVIPRGSHKNCVIPIKIPCLESWNENEFRNNILSTLPNFLNILQRCIGLWTPASEDWKKDLASEFMILRRVVILRAYSSEIKSGQKGVIETHWTTATTTRLHCWKSQFRTAGLLSFLLPFIYRDCEKKRASFSKGHVRWSAVSMNGMISYIWECWKNRRSNLYLPKRVNCEVQSSNTLHLTQFKCGIPRVVCLCVLARIAWWDFCSRMLLDFLARIQCRNSQNWCQISSARRESSPMDVAEGVAWEEAGACAHWERKTSRRFLLWRQQTTTA